VSQLWSDFVHQLEPYVPGEQPKGEGFSGLVKLNTNENPYGPSPRALAAIRAVAGDELRLYPDPAATCLREALAENCGVVAEQVFVGNGSDEVLAHVFNALLRHPKPLLFPAVTYSFYTVYCGLYGIDYRQLPLNDDYQVDIADYCVPNGGIILANPNAPTGHLLGLNAIAELVEHNRDSVVVVDEAYIDFGGHSALALIDRYPNLLVVQTFSKSRSLAGLRVGFAIGQRPLIDALERVKNSFNSYPLDALAQAGAVASLGDTQYFEAVCERVKAGRESLAGGLEALGFQVLPSAANFVFARHGRWDAALLLRELRRRKVIVRHFARAGIEQFLRISVGTDTQHQALFSALGEIVDQ
jgi:histidinol-phosphate aminotransferase